MCPDTCTLTCPHSHSHSVCTCTVPSPICITSIVYVCNSALQWSLQVKAKFWLYIFFHSFSRLKRLLVHPYKTACWHRQLLFDHILMCELERVTKWNWVFIMMLYWTLSLYLFSRHSRCCCFWVCGNFKKDFWPILWHCAVFPVITTGLPSFFKMMLIQLTLFCIWLPGIMTHTWSVYCSYYRKQHSTGLNYVNIQHLFLYSESTCVWVRECTDTCVSHFIYGLRVLYPFRVN